MWIFKYYFRNFNLQMKPLQKLEIFEGKMWFSGFIPDQHLLSHYSYSKSFDILFSNLTINCHFTLQKNFNNLSSSIEASNKLYFHFDQQKKKKFSIPIKLLRFPFHSQDFSISLCHFSSFSLLLQTSWVPYTQAILLHRLHTQSIRLIYSIDILWDVDCALEIGHQT